MRPLPIAGGFYTLPISSTAPKLRAIVLNTNLYLSGNKVTRGQTDPGNQLRWLESELQKAVDNDEKVPGLGSSMGKDLNGSCARGNQTREQGCGV